MAIRFTLISTTILAISFAAGCGKPAETKAEGKEAKAAAPAAKPTLKNEVSMSADAPELAQMKFEDVRSIEVALDEVTATARIEANPNRVGHAMIPVPGRISNVLVKLGDSVQKGQPLLSVESATIAEFETAFVQSESAVRQSQIALSKSETDLARLTDLFEHQAVAEKEVLSARTTNALSKAAVEQAQSSRDQARRRLELLGLKAGKFNQRIVIESPLAGKVMEVNVVDGEFRNEINSPVVTITDLSRVWVSSEVPESKIRQFRVGGVVQLDLIAYPGESFRARITRIADAVNNETRTIKVNAELDNPAGRYRPDMFGSLHYADNISSMPWIPESAVIRINGKDLVFSVVAPGRFMATPVELGRPHEGGFPVLNGLKAGDRIVTQGAIYLKAAL